MIAIVIIIGACIGSFCNMLIHRLPKEEDIVFKPSYCPSCSKRLSIAQLIPIIGYVWQCGKCYYCKQKISPRYIIIEIITITIACTLFYIETSTLLVIKLSIFFITITSTN